MNRSGSPKRPSSILVDSAPEAVVTHTDGVTHVTLAPLSAVTPDTVPQTPYDRVTANFLLEREQTLVDQLLLRYRNIVELAPLPEGEVTKEAAAAQTFQMRVETAGLVCLIVPLSSPLTS
jgi:hypothetical protein